MTNGTMAGTTIVKDIKPGARGSFYGGYFGAPLIDVGGTAFLFADDGATGQELWTSNGMAAGTALVKDLNLLTSSNPSALAVLGTKSIFAATNGTNGSELWVTDGTTGGTTLLKDIQPGAQGSYPDSMAVIGTKVYFLADDGTNGRELWVSDGTTAGTLLVKDINATPGMSGFNFYGLSIVGLGGLAIFEANDGTNGSELWVSNGTPGGTTILKDINTTFAGASSEPKGFALVGSKVLFTANDGTNGKELWSTDGTAMGTVLVKDINTNPNQGSFSFFGGQLTSVGGKAYFAADNGTDGNELWVSDGTLGGTTLLKNINPMGASSSPSHFMAFGTGFLFTANDGAVGTELWISDGTPGGTMLLKDIKTGGTSDSSNPSDITVVGSKAFFTADTPATGTELWVTDGTSGGTTLVKDIRPGAPSGGLNGYFGTGIVGLGGKAYFAADDGVNGSELWVSDGTAVGTMLVQNIRPGAGNAFPSGLTAFNGKLLLSASDGVAGSELWLFDPLTGGPGPGPVDPPPPPPAGPPAARPRGLVARLVKVKKGAKKVLKLRITFDDGTLKEERNSPLNPNAFSGLKAVAIDQNGDGVTDAVLVTGKNKKTGKTKTRIV